MLQKNFSIENCEGTFYHIQNCSQLEKLINYFKFLSNYQQKSDNKKSASTKACFIIQNVDSCIKAKNELQNAIQDKNLIIHKPENISSNSFKNNLSLSKNDIIKTEKDKINSQKNVNNIKKKIHKLEQDVFLDLDVDVLDEENNIVFIENHIFHTQIIQARNNISLLFLIIFMYFFVKNNFFE